MKPMNGSILIHEDLPINSISFPLLTKNIKAKLSILPFFYWEALLHLLLFSHHFCNDVKPSAVQNINNNNNSIGDLHIENSFIVLLRVINFTGTVYTKIQCLENEQ